MNSGRIIRMPAKAGLAGLLPALLPALLLALLMQASPSSAQTTGPYPNRPIKMMVVSAAGGILDTIGRIVATGIGPNLGQVVVVENRAGAGGIPGTEVVARAAPDGYTIMLASPSPIVVAPHLYKKLAYDPLKDLAPMTLIAIVPAVLVVHAGHFAREHAGSRADALPTRRGSARPLA
jgi:tripartite-type tricarboxylate transporter receptor subunit TctC